MSEYGYHSYGGGYDYNEYTGPKNAPCACGHPLLSHQMNSEGKSDCLDCYVTRDPMKCTVFADDNLNWLLKNKAK